LALEKERHCPEVGFEEVCFCTASPGLVASNSVVFTNISGIIEKGALWEVRLEKGIGSR
jgi:hypothetical protein